MESKGKDKERGGNYWLGTLEKNSIEDLFKNLTKLYKVYAPKLKDGFISYDWVSSIHELSFGYRNHESPGYYSLERQEGYFTYTHPVDSFKKLLRPSEEVLLTIKIKNNRIVFEDSAQADKVALFDVRSCDLSALKIMDKVYLNAPYRDKHYETKRENLFIVAVDCAFATKTCFCSYMNTGPHCKEGFDILLTELEDVFIVQVASSRAWEVLEGIPLGAVTEKHMEEKRAIEERVRESMKFGVNTQGLRDALYSKMDIEHYENVGKRCLACTSCTQVCPTCFCFDIVEITDTDLTTSRRVRVWDSCFSPSFATVHRFNIRESVASRYRQWLMHKFAYWIDQFGSFGCVGCGRCITWCPVGIDIREEVSRVAGS